MDILPNIDMKIEEKEDLNKESEPEPEPEPEQAKLKQEDIFVDAVLQVHRHASLMARLFGGSFALRVAAVCMHAKSAPAMSANARRWPDRHRQRPPRPPIASLLHHRKPPPSSAPSLHMSVLLRYDDDAPSLL